MIPSADHSSDHYPGIEMTIVPFFPSLSSVGCCLTLPPLMLTLPLSHSTPLLCYFGPIINDLLSSPIIATAVRRKGRRRRTTTGGVIRPFQIGSISQRTLPPRRLLLLGRPVRFNAEDRSAPPAPSNASLNSWNALRTILVGIQDGFSSPLCLRCRPRVE